MTRSDFSQNRDAAAIQFMILDLLSRILEFSDHPVQMAATLTQQIRELVGARWVVLLQCPLSHAQAFSGSKNTHKVMALEPERLHNPSLVPLLDQLAWLSHDLDASQLWMAEQAPPEVRILLEKLQSNGVIVSPLRVGETHMGALLALHLLDMQRNEDTVRALQILLPVVALILKTSQLWESQEAIIHTRTQDLAQSEQHLKRINRELRAISDCNQVLIRAKTEARLLLDICRIICETGGYPMAWVGMVEDGWVKPMAWQGREAGYLQNQPFPLEQAGPTGEAILSGQTHSSIIEATDPSGLSGSGGTLEFGYRSCIALPLLRTPWEDHQASQVMETPPASSKALKKEPCQQVFGALTIYSEDPSGFPDEERRLLEELAGDLAFGLMTLRNREEQRRAEEEKERLQSLMLASQKLEAVGRLAGGVAHDINNALSIIMGNVELLRTEGLSASKSAEFLDEIEKAALHSRDINRSLLAFSRKQVIEARPVDLNIHLTKAQASLGTLLGEDISLELNLEANLPLTLLDPGQLDRVLLNLASNARDAMPRGGHLSFRTLTQSLDHEACRSLPETHPGLYVRLDVQDTGCGMEAEVLERLFEPFFTTKPEGLGTGLGLATVFGIVKQSGGFIQVESRLGYGSCFQLHFPVLTDNQPSQAAVSESKIQKGSGRVLLVEDEESLRLVFSRLIQRLGYQALAFDSGPSALAYCQQHPEETFDLLLTDIVMPEMTGLQLRDHLQPSHSDLAVVFMSGYPADAMADRGLLEADMHFLPKPFNLDQLGAILAEALQKRGSAA